MQPAEVAPGGRGGGAPIRGPRVSAAVVEASKAAAEKALREDALRKHSKDSKQRERHPTRDEAEGRAGVTGHMSGAPGQILISGCVE